MKTHQHWICLAVGLVTLALQAGALHADGVTGMTGGGQPVSTMQPSLALNYIIADQGIFPPRDGGTPGDQYLGEVSLFAGDFAPKGWLIADGRLLSIAQNTALFSLLETRYGGDGKTTFALPDLRGRTVIGEGQGPGLANFNLGEAPGSPAVTLSIAQMPAHVHALPGGGVTGVTGGNQPFDKMQPSLALNYSINLQAIFPPQGGGLGGGPTTLPFLGQLNLFAGDFNFAGAPPTNGQLLSIAQNTAVFSLLTAKYGGNGVSNFALPDLRGRSALGAGMGPGLADRAEGEAPGAPNVSLNFGQMPPHDHSLPGGGMTGLTGVGLPYDNMQPSLALNYIIATKGFIPTENSGSPDFQTPFLGEMTLFAGSFAPDGWALANGQLLPINQFPLLFNVLGKRFGGDGQTTFALPDLRGRTAIGFGQGPGLPSYFLGQQVGSEQVTLSVDQLPPHDHTIPIPEPGGLALAALGGLALLGYGVRRGAD